MKPNYKRGDIVLIVKSGLPARIVFASSVLDNPFYFLSDHDTIEFESEEVLLLRTKEEVEGIIEAGQIKTDPLIEFLDNNPTQDVEEKKELTQKEKELVWLADFEAEQRYNDMNNKFHL